MRSRDISSSLKGYPSAPPLCGFGRDDDTFIECIHDKKEAPPFYSEAFEE
ncbi:MAG: hypothetical protein INF44_00075 [Thalassospira sp.]|nr:hypothetical protein [Thalassospira sp.]